MSDEKLLKNFESFAQAHHECHSLAWPWFVTETDNNFITGFVQKIVERRVRSSSLNIPAGEAFSILTTPTKESQAIREEKSFLSLLEKIAADEKAVSVFKEYGKEGFKYLKGELSNEFEKHHVSFGWLPYMYEGPAWEREYFSETISSIIKQGKLSKNALKEYTKEKKSFAEKQAELEEKLGFTSNELRLVRIAREIVFGKGYRKDAIYYSWCMAEPLVKEIASRLGFSPRQTRALCSWEVRNALVEHKFTARELDERFHYSAMLYTPAGNEFFAGKAARDFMAPINSEAKEISAEEVVSLFGNCACPGSVRGVARIINVPSDMEKMKPGDVLVSYATNPNLVPAMKKAAAIVTDMGGITCHAAIVSRELGIPCVIGTKNATKLLKDGDVVEVDATHGIVKKIS
ncbi:hypothetical protein HY991_00215 [Candidatus Micrarchaeota archaeon]|nr:hypothetical protein [Candidatus Micrarchaeota archaeon]